MRAGAVTYPLSAGFIRPGTDQVRTSTGVWANGTDYVLDRTRGVLRLLREPVAGETLQVTACRLIAPPSNTTSAARTGAIGKMAPVRCQLCKPSSGAVGHRAKPHIVPRSYSLKIAHPRRMFMSWRYGAHLPRSRFRSSQTRNRSLR